MPKHSGACYVSAPIGKAGAPAALANCREQAAARLGGTDGLVLESSTEVGGTDGPMIAATFRREWDDAPPAAAVKPKPPAKPKTPKRKR